MRYEDASGAFQASGPVANDDSDTLAAGSRGPATGNLITGEGTQYGAAGADTAAGAHVTAIAGKGGEDSSFAAGKLSVGGEYGQLSVDAEGNYSYMANKGAPENVRDRFTYTLADNQGNSDTAALIVEIGKTPVVIKADAQQIVPGPDGVVTLPPGVELSDIMVVGRNLVVNMPDGTQLIIVDGAVFVPQLVLGGVEVPATNVATLLIGQEPQPAAGETPPSSGGNFALPPPPLDPGVPLGDLLPPTQYTYQPPEPQETFLPEDNEPEIFVQPDGQPATVAAVDQVEEAGLPERDGDLLDEPAGSGESADGDGTDNDVNSETTTGNIIYTSEDTPNVITINGVEITSVGQVIPGDFGDLTITSIAPGIIGYSYTLHDNTDGNDTHDDFAVQLVDADGDIASATLRIDIIDDVPTARPDTDTVGDGADPFVATGNVMTDAAPGDAGDSDTNAADTVGADNARVTFIDSVNAAPGANVPDGSFVDIAGQYGTLRIFSNGDYEYTRGQDTPGGVQDVFNYTLTDGDGDTSTTTLTITIPDNTPDLPDPAAVLLDDDALANGNPGGVGDDVDSQGTPGQLVGSGGDGVLSYAFSGSNTLPAGFTTNLVDASTLQILQGGTVVLTVTLNTATGAYSVEQNNPIDHPAGGDENNLSFGIGVEVEDADGDTDGATLTINVDDDTPVISEVLSGGDVTLDESDAGSPAGFPISDTSVLPVIDVIASFGADGAAAVNATVFGLAITGGPGSGLQTAVGDFPITLVQIDGDTIEGHYNGSNVAFIIQMNGDGTVTLTQNVPLEHVVDGPPGPAHNDPLDLGGLIAATVTITDGDGDVDSASVGIGDALVFLDDGPSVSDQHVTGLVDEDGVLEGAADGGEGDGIAGGVGDVAGAPTVASGSVAAMFNSGADAPLSYGFAANTVAVLEALGLTSNGVALDYAIVGNTVTASTAAGDVFTFELNADGSWEFTLIDQLDHADGGDENDLTINLGNIIQATDADGDFVVGAADGLVITVDDDTPTASLNQVTGLVDEDGVVEGADDGGPGDGIAGGVGDVAGENTVASGSVAAMFNSGADAPLSYGFAANAIAVLEALNLSSNGIALDYAIVGNTVTASTAAGDVFTFELNADGSWEFTLIDQLDHADGGDENDLAINLGNIIEATDADGDSVVGNANGLVITVDDDTPTASQNQVTGLVDEDGVVEGFADGGDGDGIAGGVGDVPGAPTVASGSVSSLFNTGADAPLSFGFAANAVAVLEGLGLTSNGVALDYAIVGNTVTASTAAGDVFTFELNANGSWEFTLIDQLDHPTLDGLPGDDTENDLTIDLSAIIEATDADGDSVTAAQGGLVITVDDDTPEAENDSAGVGEPGESVTGNVLDNDDTGADAPATVTDVSSVNEPGNNDSNPDPDVFEIQGEFGVLVLNSDGSYEYTRDLGSPGGAVDVFTYELTDADGDSVTATLTITLGDATPNLPDPPIVRLDDDALANGNPGGTGDDVDSQGTPGQLLGTGGDAPLEYNFTGLDTLPAGFSANLVNAGTLQILQGATVVLTISLNNTTGVFSVVQNNPIDHVAGSDENNYQFLVGVEVEDVDGDVEPATITINVDDDTPTVSANAAVQLDDETETGGIAGGTGDVDPNTANTSGTLGHSFGADGAGSVAYLTTGAPAGFTYELSGSDLLIKQGTTTVITLTLNPATGQYTVTQNAPISHAPGGNENDTSFTINYRVTDGDGDTVDGTLIINSDDDTPVAAIAETGQSVSVDESVGIQVDSNDTTNAAVIALFAGVANVGTDTHLPQYAQNASAVVNSTGSAYGADGAGSTLFSLNVSSAGVDSGLNTTAGQDILLYNEGGLIVGRVSGGADDGKAAFAIAIDPVTGVISMVEYLSIQHPNAANPDDSVSIADGAVLAVVTVTDSDGDTATQQVGIGSAIQFQDSAPVMTAVQNMNIQNSGDVAHTAQFAFNLGADGANIATNDVITNVTGSATVGGVPVQNWTLTPGVENATTASYSFSFDYGIGGGATAHATGTLVFDKVAGTYTIDLASPIQGVTTILQTAQGTLFQGYEFGTSTPDGSQPEISVTQIQDLAGTANDIYVQFTSVAEPSSGTGNNALEVTNWVPGADNPPPIDAPPNPDASDFSWSAGQLFNQTDSWVSTSNDANGVAGDTIQGGEVLDFNLVQGANPTGTLANPANYAQASAMFLKFDGIGTGEDMIVILKLYDPNTNSYTTRAIMVENSDIQKGPGAGPGQYSGITLDNNDGLVIIESNDYNLPGENWVIVGAQIAGSDEDVTGTAINLNSAIGAAGDSYTGNAFDLDPDGFQSDTNDGPFKISSIGFLTTQTTPQNAQLDFNVTVTDGDGDSITQAISATITAAADSVSAATIPAGNVTINSVLPPDPAGSDSSSISNLSYSNDNGKWNGNGNNKSFSSINNTGIVAGMVAAAGLQSLAVAGSPTIESSFDVGLQGKVATIGLPAYQLQSIDDGSLNVQSFGLESSEPAFDFGALQGSSHSFSDFIDNGGLDIQSYTEAASAYQPNFQADQAPSFDASMLVASVAPAVGMPSAEALIAAGIAGVQQGGSVEQILADALGNQAPTVDGLLEAVNGGGEAISPAIEAALHALPSGGGVGDLSAVLNGASPDVGAVSGWDMHSAGSFGAGFDMMFKMDVAMLHQDAVQPAING